MRDKLDILALVFGTLGFICLAYSLLLPRWYTFSYHGEIVWMGPWMGCTWGAELQCDVDRRGNLLGLSIPMWIGTALALSAVLISGLAMRGTNCCGTSCCGDNFCGDSRRKKLFAGGFLYLISCLVTLGPVIWITTILSSGGFRDVGECLYLAWLSVGFLMAAGVLQLHHYSPYRRKEEVTQNCSPPLEHEDEEERYGEESVHFLKPETIWERGEQETVCSNKYERTAGDSVAEPARKDRKIQYV